MTLTAAAKPTVDLLLLGPVQLRAGGHLLAPGARKALALLAYLGLEGPSTRAKLAALFWPELDGASSRRNLRRELHRLRAAGADVLRDQGDEVLALEAGVRIDAAEFERRADAGDSAAAVACYRGPLLDGHDLAAPGAFEAWAGSRRERLAQRFRECLLAEAARFEAAGRTGEALACQLRLVHEDSLHESHYRAAMRLHARLGQREEALKLFERCRRELGRELGLRPMADTLELAERIRRGAALEGDVDRRATAPVDARSAGAAAGPGVARPLAERLAAPPPFTGRAAVLAEVEPALQAGRAVWLLGEPGVGKSRLALELAARRGAHSVLRADPGDAGVPYATLARWLHLQLGAAQRERLAAWARADLAHLLPGLGPVAGPIANATDRERLHAAIDEALRHALPAGLATLVFEDWHAADAATLSWWTNPGQGPRMGDSAAAPRAGPARIVTARDGEMPLPLREHLVREQGAGRAEVRMLAPLTLEQTAELLAALAGSAQPALAARLHAATAGNPLFVHETLRHLAQAGLLTRSADGHWHTPYATGGGELPVPPTVVAAVSARLAPLDEALRRLLEAASLAGGSFDAGDLAGATSLDAFEAVAAVERACALRLLVHDETGALRFGHDLIAQSLADGLSPERRRLLHRRLAAALESRGGAPARIAWHLEQAGAPAQALRWRLAAAAAAETVYAQHDALAQYDAVLAHAPPAKEEARVRLARAATLQRLVRPAEAEAEFEAAERAAVEAGDGAASMRALLAKAEHWVCSNRTDDGLALIDSLLGDDLLGPGALAQALEIRADGLMRRGRSDDAEATLRRALGALPGGPSALRGRLLMALGRCYTHRGDFATAAGWFDKAMRTYTVVGALEPLARAHFMRGACELHVARYERAGALLRKSRELAARAGSVPVQRGAILNLVKLYTQTGEVARALADIEAGIALSPLWESRVAEGAFLQARYYCHVLLGQLERAFALLPAVLANGEACDELYWRIGAPVLVVDLLLLTGDLDGAAAQLQRALALCGQDLDHDRDGYHRPLVEAKLAWLELLRGDAVAARRRLAAIPALGAGATMVETADLCRHLEAACALALGEPAAALAAVPDPDRASTEESKALQWAARVRAEAALGALAPATRRAVARLLTDESRLPVLEGLALRQAFAQALCARDPNEAAAHRAATEATRADLVASLQGEPARAAALARAFGAGSTGLPSTSLDLGVPAD